VKRLRNRRIWIPLVVIAVMAIAATAAYAWWTASATTDPNTISTGESSLEYGGSLPVNATNLVPQPTLDSTDVNDVPGAGYKTSFFWVHNNGDTAMHFEGWLDSVTGNSAILGSQVFVKITIAPTTAQGSPWDPTGSLSAAGGPYLVYQGPINALFGYASGSTLLTTVGHAPLDPGQYARYRVVTWLDGPTSTPESMNKSMSCVLKFQSVTP
jgi:predicted ribosomally synthesized peptide with SipW-like signal peptide